MPTTSTHSSTVPPLLFASMRAEPSTPLPLLGSFSIAACSTNQPTRANAPARPRNPATPSPVATDRVRSLICICLRSSWKLRLITR